MIFFAGYNGFQQFSKLCSNNDKLIAEDVIREFYCYDNFHESTLVSASWSNLIVVKNNNIDVFGFLNNESGQCISIVPPFKDHIIQCACGNGDYFFVTKSGQVWIFIVEENVWKNKSNIFNTEIVADDKTTKIIKICCGGILTAALSETGLVYCIPNVLNDAKDIKDVVCGKEHGILLTHNGSVLTWGGGSRGQLGKGDLESTETPSEVEALSGLQVVKIAAGGWHSAALTAEGDLYTWGWNKQGQLGFPILTEDTEGVSVLAIPRAVEMPENVVIEDVSCGASHTIIKTRDGSIYGCGWNKWGQLGLKGVKQCGEMTLLPIPSRVSVEKILCGPWCTLILAS